MNTKDVKPTLLPEVTNAQPQWPSTTSCSALTSLKDGTAITSSDISQSMLEPVIMCPSGDLEPLSVVGLTPGDELPMSAYITGLKISIPVWTAWSPRVARDEDLWQILINNEPVTDLVALGPHDDTPVSATIDSAILVSLPEGPFTLSYRVSSRPGDLDGYGQTLLFVKDTTAPGGKLLGSMQFSKALEDSGLTKEALDKMSGVLTASINDYYGMQEGDIVQPFVIHPEDYAEGKGPLMGAIAGDPLVIAATDVGEAIEARFTAEQLVKVDADNVGGVAAFYYSIKDKSGNESQRSPAQYLLLLLCDAPNGLEGLTTPHVGHRSTGST